MPGQAKIVSISTVPPIRNPNWTPTRVAVGNQRVPEHAPEEDPRLPEPLHPLGDDVLLAERAQEVRADGAEHAARSGRARAVAGRSRWARTEPQRRRVAPEEHVDDGRAGHLGRLVLGGDPAGDGKELQDGAEDDDEEEPPDEVRHRDPERPQPHRGRLEPARGAATPSRRPAGCRRRWRATSAVTASSSVAGSRSRMTRSASCWSHERPAEVPAAEAQEEGAVLRPPGSGQAELPPDALDVLRRWIPRAP